MICTQVGPSQQNAFKGSFWVTLQQKSVDNQPYTVYILDLVDLNLSGQHFILSYAYSTPLTRQSRLKQKL